MPFTSAQIRSRLKKLGLVSTFPAQAQFIAVQLDPVFQISCVVPAHKRTCHIRYDYESFQTLHCDSCKRLKPYSLVQDAVLAEHFNGQSADDLEYTDYGKFDTLMKEQYGDLQSVCPGIADVGRYNNYQGCPKGLKAEYDPAGTSYLTVEVSLPMTLWTHRGSQRTTVSVYALESLDNDLQGQPLRFSNIYSDGHICWGRTRAPNQLGQAFSLFWSSHFNSDLVPDFQRSLAHTLQNVDFTAGTNRDLTRMVLGDHYLVRDRPADALVALDHPDLLKVIPTRHRHYEDLAFGWAQYNELDSHYWINFKGYLCRKKKLTNSGRLYPVGLATDLT